MTNLPPVSRRTLLRGTAATSLGLAAGVQLTGTANAAPGGFPNYNYVRVAFNKANLRYNPTGELIFPSVRGTVGRISNALGRFYLYYAPHDAPGGLCLAYSNSLGGPYTEYPNNPIIARTWSPHYNVSHVSSPHSLWNDDVNEMWMYFHGENTTTRLARSTNGINFTYDKVVLSTSMLPAGTTEASYARVFRHDLPSKGARYVMVFMINTTANRRSIGWGWSPEGRNWTFSQTPLITPQELGCPRHRRPGDCRAQRFDVRHLPHQHRSRRRDADHRSRQEFRQTQPPRHLPPTTTRSPRQRPIRGTRLRLGQRRRIHDLRSRRPPRRLHRHRPSRLDTPTPAARAYCRWFRSVRQAAWRTDIPKQA